MHTHSLYMFVSGAYDYKLKQFDVYIYSIYLDNFQHLMSSGWLNASQRSRVGVGMRTGVRGQWTLYHYVGFSYVNFAEHIFF